MLTVRKGRIFIIDDVLRHPEIIGSHDAADTKAAWFSRMVATQCLEIAAATDLLPRLRIFADDVIVVNLMLCFQVSGCRRIPVLIQRSPVLLSSHVLSATVRLVD